MLKKLHFALFAFEDSRKYCIRNSHLNCNLYCGKVTISSYRVIILIKPQLIVHYITRSTRCLSIGKHIFPVTDTPIPVGKIYFLPVLLPFTQGFPTTHRQPTHGLYPFLTSMGRCPEQRGICLMNRDWFDSHVCSK